MLTVRRDTQTRSVISVGPEIQSYFLGDRAIPTRRTSKLDAGWMARTIAELDRQEADRHRGELEAQLVHAQRLESVGRLAGGIGAAIALGYVEQGAKVVVADIVTEGGRETVERTVLSQTHRPRTGHRSASRDQGNQGSFAQNLVCGFLFVCALGDDDH